VTVGYVVMSTTLQSVIIFSRELFFIVQTDSLPLQIIFHIRRCLSAKAKEFIACERDGCTQAKEFIDSGYRLPWKCIPRDTHNTTRACWEKKWPLEIHTWFRKNIDACACIRVTNKVG